MRHRLSSNTLILVLALHLMCGILIPPCSLNAEENKNSVTDLGLRQQRAQLKLKEFERTIFRAIESLRDTDPKQAEKLQKILEHSVSKRLENNMEKIAAQLNSGELETAQKAQDPLYQNLRLINELLNKEENELDQLKERIEQLQAWKEKVDKIAKDEWQQQDDSSQFEKNDQRIEEQKQAISKLEELIKKQKELSQNTLDSQLKAAEQKGLQEETISLAESIQKGAATKDNKSQSQSPGVPSMQNASKNQGNAAQALSEQKKKLASKNQNEALKDLEKALAEMKQEQKRLEELDQQAMQNAQDQSMQEASDLLSQMSEASSNSNSKGEPQAGQEPLQQAAQSMAQASKQLQKQDNQKASEQQKKAYEALKEAESKLSEEIADLQEQLRNENLSEIKTILNEMIALHTPAYENTIKLNKAISEKLSQTQERKLQNIKNSERKVSNLSTNIQELIKDDDSSFIVSDMMIDSQEWLTQIDDLLTKQIIGEQTQEIQFMVQVTLVDLLEVLDNKNTAESDSEPEESEGSSPPPPSEKPLFDLLMQYKMLRKQQFRINELTIRHQKNETMHKPLSSRQQRVADLTNKLNQKTTQPTADLDNKPIQKDSLSEAHNLMENSRDRLNNHEVDQMTMKQQSEIVSILDKLIKQAEESASQSSKESSGGKDSANAPAQVSQLPPSGAPGKKLASLVQGSDDGDWAKINEKHRESIRSELNSKFPDRYRHLIEQYYQSLQNQSDDK